MADHSAEALQAQCEKHRCIGVDSSTRLAPTGEPFVMIGSQIGIPDVPGTVGEGCPREFAFDVETAYFQAWTCFENYQYGRPGTLYWRTRPRLEWEGKRCMFYMRCLISEKPILVEAATEGAARHAE